ncbi:MAG: hypothetical protein RBS36_02830 [Thiomicrospira sp.]|jgi:hypothetical protein|nr:hypothetical protein [Thiomicrospira sp.]
MKKWIMTCLLAFPFMVLANPSPFGLTLNQATVAELKQKYSAKMLGYNKYSGGEVYQLTPDELGIDGLQKATAIFDEKGVLQGILTELPKHRFDQMYQLLSAKYKVVSSQIPFVGSKTVTMRDGETEITLNAPHLSFEMEMSYLTQSLLNSFKATTSQEEQAKKQKEMNNL